MISTADLESSGYSPDKFKTLFTSEKQPDKVKSLIDVNASRINEGIERCMSDARMWWAIDQATEVSHRQVTFTLVDGLIGKGMSGEQVMNALNTWGISHQLRNMLTPVTNSDGTISSTDGKPNMKLDMPTFFNIFVPLVSAYMKIRWAKLCNDRDIYPLYKYEPVRMTRKDRLQCDVITSRMRRMTQDMDYRSAERQSIWQMLKYGICLNFVTEPWYSESQGVGEDKTVVKEGVRFEIPHPARMFWDMAYPAASINSDTGMSYAGYWTMRRYGDLASNSGFWNTEESKIHFRHDSAWAPSFRTFQQLYPCHVKMPFDVFVTNNTNDRIEMANRYTRHHHDTGVIVTSIYHKLIPKEWGLYDYDCPVWHRFVYAGYDTVIHAVPMAYTPIVAYLYDSDLAAARPTPLSLELLPFQDHLSNLLTQYILSVKQNLARVVFWNTDVVDQKYMKLIENLGEKMYRGVSFIPFSSRELGWQKENVGNAFANVQFPRANTAEIATAIMQMLGLMERALGYSSQELGAPASHEQSAHEVSIIATNTGHRIQLTGSFVDSGIHARKRLLYDAWKAYGSDEIVAEVETHDQEDEKVLKDIGFDVTSQGGISTNLGVTGLKSKIDIDAFASDRENASRIQDSKIAATMIQTFQALFSNPMVMQAVGIEQLLEMFNQILAFAGVPDEYRVRVKIKPADAQGADPAQQQEQQKSLIEEIQKQIVEISSKVTDEKLGQVAQGIKTGVVDPMQEQFNQAGQAIAQLSSKEKEQEQILTQMADTITRLIREQQAQGAVLHRVVASAIPPNVTPQPSPIGPAGSPGPGALAPIA